MKTIVVTGASSGIGQATARYLIQCGFQVFGSVRREEDGARLRAALGESFTPLLFDVTDEEAVRRGAAQVREHLSGETLLGLVNNAGVSVPGPLAYLPLDDFRRQLEVNLVGVLAVTQAFLPLLGADGSRRGPKGRIVNISSVGGRMAGPFLGAYHASKFGLEGLSESLRRELMRVGVDVIVVGPGAVTTAIWDKAEDTDITRFQNTEYGPALAKFREYALTIGRRGLPPERVAAVIYKALTAHRPRVRYAVVAPALTNALLPALLPKRTLDKLIARRFGLWQEK